MGVDINMFAEVKKAGSWQYHEPSKAFQEKMGPSKGEFNMPLFDVRSYSTFSVLAGVCNTIRIERPVAPIATPKGKPNDLSPEVARELASFGSDAHDISWLTLSEIQDYNWNQMIKCVGYVDPEYEVHFKNRPKTFPAGVPSIFDYSENRVKVNWFVTSQEACGRFYTDVLPYLGQQGEPSHVRVVFWFES